MTLATRKQPTTTKHAKLIYDRITEQTWSEDAYLAFARDNLLCELSEGKLEVLEMPTPEHQRIVRRLVKHFERWLSKHALGEMLFAPVPIRLWPGKFREPDIIVYLTAHLDRIGETFGGVPDLVVEVLSPGTRDQDLTTKFREYALAGISEYWIVDPKSQTIQIHALGKGDYASAEHFGAGQSARSSVLNGLHIAVDDIFGKEPE